MYSRTHRIPIAFFFVLWSVGLRFIWSGAANAEEESIEQRTTKARNYVDSFTTGKQLSPSSERMATITKELLQELVTHMAELQRQFERYGASSVLEFDNLADKAELDGWLTIVTDYEKAARSISLFLDSFEETAVERLHAAGITETDDFLRGYHSTLEQKKKQGFPSPSDVSTAHLRYAEDLHRFLSFLKKNSSDWSIDSEGELDFESDELIDSYNSFIDSLQALETKLNDILTRQARYSEKSKRPSKEVG